MDKSEVSMKSSQCELQFLEGKKHDSSFTSIVAEHAFQTLRTQTTPG